MNDVDFKVEGGRKQAYQVRHLVARKQRANQRSRIASQDQHLLYPAVRDRAVSYNSISKEPTHSSRGRYHTEGGGGGMRGKTHCLHSPGETWLEMRLAAGWAARREEVLVQLR